jgi:hypothetical protein
MNKRTIQIDVIGPIEETELMKCKLYVDGRVCVIGMSLYDYEELMREKVFIRDGKSVDSAGHIVTFRLHTHDHQHTNYISLIQFLLSDR